MDETLARIDDAQVVRSHFFRSSAFQQLLLKFGLFVFSICAIVLREPNLFLQPRFFAEEGRIYFQHAFNNPWYLGFSNVDVGYLNLWPSLATLVAAKFVPLLHAPLVTTLFAFVVQLLPTLIVIGSSSEIWKRPFVRTIGVLLLTFLPGTNESWLNTINSQFFFQLSVFLILIEDNDLNTRKKIAYRVILICAGLTGLISAFLIPLFGFRWYCERNREKGIQTLLLFATACVQGSAIFYLFLQKDSHIGSRLSSGIGIRTTISILFTRCIGIISLGYPLVNRIAEHVYPIVQSSLERMITPILLLISEFVYFVFVSQKLRWNEKVIWVGAFFSVFIPSVLFAVGSQSKSELVHTGYAQRYFVVPCAILMLLLLFNYVRAQTKIRRAIFFGMFSLAFLFGMQYASIYSPSDPSFSIWKDEVQHWQADSSYSLRIWPNGWEVQLPSLDGK